MTRPDLDAIRARWQKRGHSFADTDEFQRYARTDIPSLLAYIEELEGRATYTVGETEWAHRIAVAEQRFVDEYDARKAAEREIAELKARIAVLEAMKP
jgi:hypothetical protein